MKDKRILNKFFSALLMAMLFYGCSHPPKVTEFKLTGAKLPETFLMGSHLCRVPMPPVKELLSDMENLKSHGFNLIKLQTHWAVDEPLIPILCSSGFTTTPWKFLSTIKALKTRSLSIFAKTV